MIIQHKERKKRLKAAYGHRLAKHQTHGGYGEGGKARALSHNLAALSPDPPSVTLFCGIHKLACQQTTSNADPARGDQETQPEHARRWRSTRGRLTRGPAAATHLQAGQATAGRPSESGSALISSRHQSSCCAPKIPGGSAGGIWLGRRHDATPPQTLGCGGRGGTDWSSCSRALSHTFHDS